MFNLDDIKVGLATAAGITNWMANIDLILQIAISVASLVYIVLKVKEQLNKNGS
jgi:hypothetical protein|tara:strand:- start:326 stop:487 length:162 start_codon:yes stop_codon:yes gene_type:complete